MRTFTICLHNDHDAELLKNFIETAEFSDEIETYEDEDEFTDEDIAEFDKRMAAYEKIHLEVKP